MNAIVVYESFWGNTAAVARAIAEGIGPDARALATGEATTAAIEAADLIVAGAPVLGFNLPTEGMRKTLPSNTTDAPAAPDLSQPSMRAWIESLPSTDAKATAFETRIWWSPGSATKAIQRGLAGAGCTPLCKEERFIVTGRYGPLRDGELERAREWGKRIASAM
ncbi:MAG: flavodoxin family protein [Coriobacteriales bacterium]|nr:flavodoxin family protein [Coriobacteriales bacterium]